MIGDGDARVCVDAMLLTNNGDGLLFNTIRVAQWELSSGQFASISETIA